MDNIIQYILHAIFAFAYPVAFLGAIFFSINSFISIDFFSAFFNKSAGFMLNIYVGICGYVAFCVFYNIDIVVNDTVYDFKHIYTSFDKFNDTFEIPGLSNISLSG